MPTLPESVAQTGTPADADPPDESAAEDEEEAAPSLPEEAEPADDPQQLDRRPDTPAAAGYAGGGEADGDMLGPSEVQPIIECWGSRGTWQPRPVPPNEPAPPPHLAYRWVPDAACSPPGVPYRYLDTDSSLVCDALAARGRVLLVGDSLTQQFYASLADRAGVSEGEAAARVDRFPGQHLQSFRLARCSTKQQGGGALQKRGASGGGGGRGRMLAAAADVGDEGEDAAPRKEGSRRGEGARSKEGSRGRSRSRGEGGSGRSRKVDPKEAGDAAKEEPPDGARDADAADGAEKGDAGKEPADGAGSAPPSSAGRSSGAASSTGVGSGAPRCEVWTSFAYNKFLSLATEEGPDKRLLPWLDAFEGGGFEGVVVLNRGQWLADDAAFAAGWRDAIAAVRAAAPKALVIARNTPPGAPNCSLFSAPVSAPPALPGAWNVSWNAGDVYSRPSWPLVDAQAALLEALVRREVGRAGGAPGVIAEGGGGLLHLDVRSSSRLRPDSHRSSQGVGAAHVFLNERGRKLIVGDCLHYRSPSDVQRTWAELLLNAVALHERVAGGREGGPCGGGKQQQRGGGAGDGKEGGREQQRGASRSRRAGGGGGGRGRQSSRTPKARGGRD